MFQRLQVVAKILVALAFLATLSGCDSAEERAQSHYEQGLALLAEGEPVKAGLEFRNALSLKKDHVPALFELARVERQQGRFDRAVQFFASVVEQAPDHVDARVELGNILLLAGQLDKALKIADEAYALSKNDPDVLVLKAAISLKLDDRTNSVRLANAALEIDPQNVNAAIVLAAERMLAADPDGALAYLDRASKTHDRDLGLQMFRLRALEAIEDPAGVEEVFVKLTGYYPDNGGIWFAFARWYLEQGRKADAEKVVRQFADNNPDNVSAGLSLVRFIGNERGAEAARSELEARIAKGGEIFPYQMALGELLFAQGKQDDAVTMMRTLVDEKGDSQDAATARIQLARMMMARDKVSEAEELIDTVLADDDKNINALLVRAAIRVAARNYDRAIEDLTAALNEAPQSSRILRLLADVHERNGSIELAEENLVKAVRAEDFQPDVGLSLVDFLLRYGKVEQAERALTEIRAVAPSDKRVLTQLARLRLARQDWIGAEEVAAVLRKLDGEGTTADRIVAAALSGQQKYSESIEVLRKLSADNPDGTAGGIAPLVSAYVGANKPEEAEEFVRSVLESDPDNVQAHVVLASLHAMANRLEMAEASLKTAVDKDSSGVVGNRALAEFYLRSDRMEEAEKAIRAALSHQNDSIALRLLLATTLERRGDYDTAISEYQALFEKEPRSSVVANNLASLLAEYRDDPESIEAAYRIASRFRNSDVPQFVDTLGWASYRKGEFEEAVTFLKTAAEKLPDFSMVHYHLGMAYKELGKKDLAIASLEKAISGSDVRRFPQRDKAIAVLSELEPTSRPTN